MNFLIYVLFVILEKLIPLFPLTFLQWIAKVKGYFFFYLLPIRKKTAYNNLKLAFPEKSDKEIKEIIKRCYVNILTVITEFFFMKKFSMDDLKKFIMVSNPELISEKLKLGKGLIFISAHFGNWELTAYGISQLAGIPLYIVVKEQSNKRIDAGINKIRSGKGNIMIDMKNSVREILSALKGNQAVAMLGDQSAPKENVKVDFFVKDVPAFEGTARIALKTGAAVLFGVSERNDDGTYSLTFQVLDTGKYGNSSEENIRALTQEHVNMLIEHIKQRPDHWLWFHRRFKHVR
jgi:KDO2-lipid IV(A) lauroyltransferase